MNRTVLVAGIAVVVVVAALVGGGVWWVVTHRGAPVPTPTSNGSPTPTNTGKDPWDKVVLDGQTLTHWLFSLSGMGDAKERAKAEALVRKRGKDLVPDLQTVLERSTQTVYRLAAIKALGIIGPDARSAVPQILPHLADSDASVRVEAIETLGLIGLDTDKEALDRIAAMLKDKEWTVRRSAAATLAQTGVKGKSTGPALEAAFRESAERKDLVRSKRLEEDKVRISVLQALAAVEADGLVSILKEGVADVSVDVRYQATLILGKIGVTVKEAVPILIEVALQDPDAELRRRATVLAKQLDPEAARQAGLQ
jgi:HEAT repeat protein